MLFILSSGLLNPPFLFMRRQNAPPPPPPPGSPPARARVTSASAAQPHDRKIYHRRCGRPNPFTSPRLFHFVQRSVEPTLSVHILPIFPSLILRRGPTGGGRKVVLHLLLFRRTERPAETHHLFHRLVLGHVLQFFGRNLYGTLRLGRAALVTGARRRTRVFAFNFFLFIQGAHFI